MLLSSSFSMPSSQTMSSRCPDGRTILPPPHSAYPSHLRSNTVTIVLISQNDSRRPANRSSPRYLRVIPVYDLRCRQSVTGRDKRRGGIHHLQLHPFSLPAPPTLNSHGKAPKAILSRSHLSKSAQ
jgi:hypothetical protein